MRYHVDAYRSGGQRIGSDTIDADASDTAGRLMLERYPNATVVRTTPERRNSDTWQRDRVERGRKERGSTMRKIEEGSPSPWGAVQHVSEYGQGIVMVSTAGHGGFYVPTPLLGRINADRVKWSAAWSGSRNWFEEDCAACFVCDAFPELFPARRVQSCRESIDGFYTDFMRAVVHRHSANRERGRQP